MHVELPAAGTWVLLVVVVVNVRVVTSQHSSLLQLQRQQLVRPQQAVLLAA